LEVFFLPLPPGIGLYIVHKSQYKKGYTNSKELLSETYRNLGIVFAGDSYFVSFDKLVPFLGLVYARIFEYFFLQKHYTSCFKSRERLTSPLKPQQVKPILRSATGRERDKGFQVEFQSIFTFVCAYNVQKISFCAT
jgi:hypothetical protein